MRTKRSFSFFGFLALAALAISLAPTSASAYAYGGKFTLPFQARWGGLVLPAGDYSFSVDSLTPAGKVVVQRDGKFVGMVMVGPGATYSAPRHSKLEAVPIGQNYRITAMHVQYIGVISFPTPRKERQLPDAEFQLSAQIPIVTSGT